MDASLPSQVLAAQHRRIDTGVQGIVDGTGETAALVDSLALLRLHLYAEETVLFPPLVKSGLTMPVFVMKREHGEMWPMLQTLTAACADGQPVETMRDTCRRLFQLLRVHNPKEEMIVYTAADKLAAQPAGASLAKSLDAARVPDGWVCEMASRGLQGPAFLHAPPTRS